MMRKIIAVTLFTLLPSMSYSAPDSTPEEESQNYKVVAGNDLMSLGKFSDWEAFFLQQDNEILCWVSSYPIKFKQKKHKDKEKSSYLMTTVRPMRKIRDEFSFHIPTDFEDGKKVKISVDGKAHYSLDTQGRWAWLRSSLDEERMVISSRNGNFLNASYYKEDHKKATRERFSLSGFTKAYETAVEKCAPYFYANHEEDSSITSSKSHHYH